SSTPGQLPRPVTEEEEEEIEADEKAYKRSLNAMKRFAARQKLDDQKDAGRELHRRVNEPQSKRTPEQKKADEMWEEFLDRDF
ncbi:unnamed protein product, partial [Ectocarpus sp. 12 AP-2014]